MSDEDYNKLFSQLPEVKMPAGLIKTVICRIREEEFRTANRRQLVALLAITVVSVLGISYFSWTAIQDLHQAGFFDFIILAFTEPTIITQSGKAFLMSLAESMPGLSLLIPIAIIFGYMEALKMLAKTFRPPKTANCRTI